MNLSVHFFMTCIITIVLYPFIGLYSFASFLGGFFIDGDHYLWSLYRNRSFSFKEAYRYHKDRHENEHYEKNILHIFHTIEFFILIIVLLFVSHKQEWQVAYLIILITLANWLFHLSLDIINIAKKKVWDARANSIIYWLIKKS